MEINPWTVFPAIGALVVLFFTHLLTKDRDTGKGREERKREFLALLQSWRSDADFKGPSMLANDYPLRVPAFSAAVERVRSDIKRKAKFDELVDKVRRLAYTHPSGMQLDEHRQILDEIMALVRQS